jgi:hypothetical protein
LQGWAEGGAQGVAAETFTNAVRSLPLNRAVTHPTASPVGRMKPIEGVLSFRKWRHVDGRVRRDGLCIACEVVSDGDNRRSRVVFDDDVRKPVASAQDESTQ